MKNRLLLHVLFWLGYVLFEGYVEFAWISNSFHSMTTIDRFLMAAGEEALQLTIKVPFIYAVFYFVYTLAPRWKMPQLVVVPVLALIILGIIGHRILVNWVILPHIYLDKTITPLFQINRVISSFLDLLVLLTSAIAVKQFRLHQQLKESEKNLRKEKLEAELKFLRTQTNPHFLFNTLNNIYALARKKSDDTADVVMKLSKLLRFMLYESRKDCITVAEELRVLDDYLELEKIRYNNRLTVNFIRKVDDDSQRITPLILLPFVENAFKHGASETRFDSFIDIEASLDKGWLRFHIKNSKDEDGNTNISENIGLGNVRRQLELMYPEHELKLENGLNFFEVTLTINLLKHASI